MGQPYLPDYNTLLMAGINPKTGLPIRADIKSAVDCNLPDGIYKSLSILDEQDAVNRYVWYNLPSGLDGQLIERILYFKGQGMFFYMPADDNFYFLPFALNGTIDVYGRFNDVTPLPFNGTAKDEKDAWIVGLTRKVIKKFPDEPNLDMYENGCVLLNDYIIGISQLNIPRKEIQTPILKCMSEAFPLARTNLLANCGVKGMRVTDQDQQSNVEAATNSMYKAAMIGKPLIPIVGTTEFQELTDGTPSANQDYLVYMQSLDNYRLSLYGLKNGGLFEKDSEYVNDTQAGNVQQNVGLIYQDGLTIRQKFCDIVNAIWGIDIWCDSSETVTNTDNNMDGQIDDNQDQSGIEGQQDNVTEGNNNV